MRGFEERGFQMVQSGDWNAGNQFAFFEDREKVGGVWFETIVFGEGVMPAAEGVWPPTGAEGGNGEEASVEKGGGV